MDLSRLRGGELIAGVGGIVLLVALLFLNWYSGVSVETGFGEFEVGGELGAWDRQGILGTLANLVILAAGVVGVGVALLTATSSTVALPVAASALTAAAGVAAVAMVVLRMLFQPGDGQSVDLEVGIFVALIGAVAVAYGGWQSMQEEGTTFEAARDRLQDRFGNDAAGPSAAGGPAGPATPPAAPSGREPSAAPSVAEPPPPEAEPLLPADESLPVGDQLAPPGDELGPPDDELAPPDDERSLSGDEPPPPDDAPPDDEPRPSQGQPPTI